MTTKISVVFWTAYMLSIAILWHQGINPKWLMAFIPTIVLCINSWLEYITDLILDDEETLIYLFGDKWDEIKGYFEDDEDKENKETNPEDEIKDDAEDDSKEGH